jgi:molybdopterin-containing oxidoreductase family iron-sulfur binding subunit
MNLALGNAGATVTFTQTAEAQPIDQRAALRELVGEMNAGTVEFLVILGSNPVYSAPADLQFAKALEKVAVRAHLGLYEDETARSVTGIFPKRTTSKHGATCVPTTAR